MGWLLKQVHCCVQSLAGLKCAGGRLSCARTSKGAGVLLHNHTRTCHTVQVREGELATAEGVSYLEAKHLLLLHYCTAIVFYLLLKAVSAAAAPRC